MKTCDIYYLLSEKGRKDSIKKGGNGKIIQCLTVDITDELLKYCSVYENGKAILVVGFEGNDFAKKCLNIGPNRYSKLEDIDEYSPYPIEYNFVIDHIDLTAEDGEKYVEPLFVPKTKQCIKFDEVQTYDSILDYYRKLYGRFK